MRDQGKDSNPSPRGLPHRAKRSSALAKPVTTSKVYWRSVPGQGTQYSDILLVSAGSLARAASLFDSPVEAVHESTAPGLLGRATEFEVEEVWSASADQIGPGGLAQTGAFLPLENAT